MQPNTTVGVGIRIAALVAAIALIWFQPPECAAAEPEQLSLSLKAGETYVIDGLKPDVTPSYRVLNNPNALLPNTDVPGKLVLVGAETGRWMVNVTRSDGTPVSYDVVVKAIANWDEPLKPGTAPPAMNDAALRLRPGEGAASSASSATAAGETISIGKAGGYAAGGSSTLPAIISPSPAASGHASAAAPGAAGPPILPTQEVGPVEVGSKGYRNDPSVLGSGLSYYSTSVSGGRNYLTDEAVDLMIGTSEVIDFRRRLTRVSIADSKIADVQVVNPYQLNLVGHEPGFTTLAVWDDQGRYEERQVRVDPSGRQQVMLNVIVAELNRNNLENQGINYSVALADYGVSLVGLPGTVATPFSQQTTSSGASQATVLPPGGNIIPLLLSPNLTYGLSAQNSHVLTQTLFQYLETHQLIRILAQPHLLANSGERAKFLAGGEIPIVIAQALNTSIVFKQFGTAVDFVPTVVGRDQIELLVKPEVSEPDYSHAVELFGFTVPAFVVRRAETLVRLKDSQTLIMAGLIDRQKRAEVDKVPYLGDIPYVGGLFRHTYWQEQDSDLVMSVTPQIVTPLPQGGATYLPYAAPPLSSKDIRTERTALPDASRPRF
jgi:Flp pilus assembly secretin CpaC